MKQINKYLSGRFCYKTDIGKVRKTNEDEALGLVNARGDVLLIICDGMGGYKKGDLASQMCISFLRDKFLEIKKFFSINHCKNWLRRTIQKVNKQIYNKSINDIDCEGMGTTLTCVLINKNKYVLANAGDSRAYEFKAREVVQISEDQTYVNSLYKKGDISKEEMLTHPRRHELTNAIGAFSRLSLDISIHSYKDTNFLLCSDGLYNNVSSSDISNILKSDDTIEQKTNSLVNLANLNGGSDNIGLVIWESQSNVD